MAWLVVVVMSAPAFGQVIVDQGERLDSDRPEAWAMAYMSASTLFSGFGPAKGTEPGQVSVGVEAGHVPHLSREQRRVGFNGTKLEDLNKSPVFGRLRLTVGLPASFTLAIGWTPPVEIDGARPRDFFAIALERPLYEHEGRAFSARLFHQRGRVQGNMTCDRETASHEPGSPQNPFGCRAPSDDRFKLDQTGLELALSQRFRDGRLEPYLSYTATRMKPRTRVRAQTFGVLDRSRLSTRMTTHTATAGVIFRPRAQWEALAAVAWTPLDARRPPDDAKSRDDLVSARLMLRRTW